MTASKQDRVVGMCVYLYVHMTVHTDSYSWQEKRFTHGFIFRALIIFVNVS